MPRKFSLPARDVDVLHQQINQLSIVDPYLVHVVAGCIGNYFDHLLKDGRVVPLDAPVFRAKKRKH